MVKAYNINMLLYEYEEIVTGQARVTVMLTRINIFLNICTITYTAFDPIGARGAYINLFSTTSGKRSSSGL